MKQTNRILILLVLVAILTPTAPLAFLSLDERNNAQEDLEHAIGTAVNRYRERSGLQALRTKGEKIKQEQGSRLVYLEKRKKELRDALIVQHHIISFVEKKYGIDIASKDQMKLLISAEKSRLARQLRAQYVRQMRTAVEHPRGIVLDTLFHGSAKKQGEEIVGKTQRKFLEDLVAAEKAVWRMESIEAQREETLREYHGAQSSYESATAMIERSEEEMEEIKAIMAEVHEQVLKLQGELARIDARLKRKAERTLIEKGLLDPKEAGSTPTLSLRPLFSWPVYGRTSAGFLNADYQKHFGVPHYGMDIVVGQGTPVASAADGVVFLVRDGGAKGYTYILIGHRGGYATLYGHLSATTVEAGQDIDAGQIIGLSGAQPGTPGAGPMTTGPHLHFEVIQGGVNVDPKTVLP